MAKDLARRDDIREGALRQRRDFYAISIGLLLYYAAGGSLESSVSTSVLPLKFDKPVALLIAAWLGWIYFLWRYWLFTPADILALFREEREWQLRASKRIRRIAISLAKPNGANEEQYLRWLKEKPNPPLPIVRKINRNWRVELNAMSSAAGEPDTFRISQDSFELSKKDSIACEIENAISYFYAAIRERTFTDYILPYGFGLLTIFSAVYSASSVG
jgi:hypothetical protein